MQTNEEIANEIYKSKPNGFDDYFNRICSKLKENNRCSNLENVEHEVCGDMYKIWHIIERRYLNMMKRVI